MLISSRGPSAVVGIEDRDWYREKQIDWERGGLKDRNSKRRRGPLSAWWVVLAVLVIAAAVWYRFFF